MGIFSDEMIDGLKKVALAVQKNDTSRVSADYLLSSTDEEAEEIKIQDQSFADKIRLLDSLDGKENGETAQPRVERNGYAMGKAAQNSKIQPVQSMVRGINAIRSRPC